MKTLYASVVAVAIMTALSGSVLADGSKMEYPPLGSKLSHSNITNNSENDNAQTTASGKNAVALTGTIAIEGSQLDNSNITNTSKNNNAQTTASGENSTAATGSIYIR